ncbi:MAG: hypothetical protein ACC661_06700, partial [Verrucomicrobiales bacterium]
FSEVLTAKMTADGLNPALLATPGGEDLLDFERKSEHFIPWDYSEDTDLARIVSHLDKHGAVVVDVGSGDALDLHSFCKESQFFECLGELDIELTLAIPLNGSPENADAVVEIAEAFSDNADYVIVRRGLSGKEDASDGWEGSYGQKVMSYLGAAELSAPPVRGALAKSLETHGCLLEQALANLEHVPADLRKSLTKWESQFQGKIIDLAGDYLIPESEETRVLGLRPSQAIAC